MATFKFNGQISAVIKIKDKTYTLKSDAAMSGTGAAKLDLKYHAGSLDEAIVLGKMGELVDGASTLADEIGKALNLNTKFTNSIWTELKTQATALPGLGAVFGAVIDTEIRITDIELLLDAPLNATDPISKGKVTFGIVFDSRNVSGNSVLGISLQAVGVLLSFSYGS